MPPLLCATPLLVPRPDFTAVAQASELEHIVGALLTYALICAVLMIVICSTAWAVASACGSWQGASKAKVGVLIALGGATLAGTASAWSGWLLGIGPHL